MVFIVLSTGKLVEELRAVLEEGGALVSGCGTVHHQARRGSLAPRERGSVQTGLQPCSQLQRCLGRGRGWGSGGRGHAGEREEDPLVEQHLSHLRGIVDRVHDGLARGTQHLAGRGATPPTAPQRHRSAGSAVGEGACPLVPAQVDQCVHKGLSREALVVGVQASPEGVKEGRVQRDSSVTEVSTALSKLLEPRGRHVGAL